MLFRMDNVGSFTSLDGEVEIVRINVRGDIFEVEKKYLLSKPQAKLRQLAENYDPKNPIYLNR